MGRRCNGRWSVSLMLVATLAVGAIARAARQGQGQTPSPLPLSHSVRERGSSVTGAYEGWYREKDGSVRILVGYFNRNTKQELDIPIGPNNSIEPSGPDQGQPTHFLTGRQWGVFSIKAPADFANQKLTWTLVANGQTNTITMHARPEWLVEPFEDAASKNTPPSIKLEPAGPSYAGPPGDIAKTFTTTMSRPIELTAWITDEPAKLNVANALLTISRPATGSSGAPAAPPALVTWSQYRGPGNVTFDKARPSVDPANGGKTTTTASFSAPGDYVLRLQANDQSGDGGGGFQCCWTNVHVAVTVKP